MSTISELERIARRLGARGTEFERLGQFHIAIPFFNEESAIYDRIAILAARSLKASEGRNRVRLRPHEPDALPKLHRRPRRLQFADDV